MEKGNSQAGRLEQGGDSGANSEGGRGAFTPDQLREAITKKTAITARLRNAEARLNGMLQNIERHSLKKLLKALEIVQKHKAMMLDDERYSIQTARNLVQELEDALVEETPDDSARHDLLSRHVGKSEQRREQG
ncbi:MAG: hypothetical protein GWN86_26980 [Desulfobacterales bacterium]|nr:hypothetical protein [Desulfobacterales bacterium]